VEALIDLDPLVVRGHPLQKGTDHLTFADEVPLGLKLVVKS
jgi:hypothetical protein